MVGATVAQWYLDGPTYLIPDCRTWILQHHYHHQYKLLGITWKGDPEWPQTNPRLQVGDVKPTTWTTRGQL